MSQSKDKPKDYIIQLRDEAQKERKDKDKIYHDMIKVYETDIWDLSSNDSNESPYYNEMDTNYIKKEFDTRLASLNATDYSGELLPRSSEEEPAVNDLNLVYKSLFVRAGVPRIIPKLLKYGGIMGEAYAKINIDSSMLVPPMVEVEDPETGEIYEEPDSDFDMTKNDFLSIDYVSPEKVYLDPRASSFDEINYYFTREKVSMEWIKSFKEDWYKKLTGNNDWEKATMTKQPPNHSDVHVDVLYMKSFLLQKPDKDEKKKDIEKYPPILIYYIINNTVVEIFEDYPFDFFPITQFTWAEKHESPYSDSLFKGLVKLQQQINAIDSSISNIAYSFASPITLADVDNMVEIQNANDLADVMSIPAPVISVRGGKDLRNIIHQIESAKIDANLLKVKDDAIEAIKEIFGVTGQYLGNIGSSGNTASGTADSIFRATIIDIMPIRQIEIFVEKLSLKLIDNIKHYYSGEELEIRQKEESIEKVLQGQQFDFKPVDFDQKLIKTQYDFSIRLIPKIRNNDEQQAAVLKEMLRDQEQYDSHKHIIKQIDVLKRYQLDDYPEFYRRHVQLEDEELHKKATLMMQLTVIAQITHPETGEPLISQEELMEALVEIQADGSNMELTNELLERFNEYQLYVESVEQEASVAQNMEQNQNQ